MPDLQAPPHNKMHTWIIVLLFWILALLVFIVGYLVYGGKPAEKIALTPTELAGECTSAGFVDAATVPDDAGECPEPEDGEVIAHKLFPGFSYPIGWSVHGRSLDPNSNDSYAITINSGPDLQYCIGCDAPGAPITITMSEADLGTFPTLEAYVRAENEASFEFTNVVVAPFEVAEGLQGFEVTGHLGGFGDDDVNYVYVLTATDLIVVRNSRVTAGINEGWELIKNSLDFSKIE